MLELPDPLYQQITALCEEGDALSEDQDYDNALDSYWAAFDLLPPPQEQWEAATWILGSIGDTNFQAGDYDAARENLAGALTCPDGPGNPFLHLRLGEAEFELNNLDSAADELERAFVSGGLQVFEDEDPKYLAFLKTRIPAPEGGW